MKRHFGSGWVLELFCLVMGLGLLIEPWAGTAQARPQTFVAQGTAPLQSSHRAQSRAQALEDLLRQAVWQAAGTLLSGQELAQKSTEVRKNVLAQAERYAQSFKIIDEYVEGDLYRVQGAVDVAMEMLRADLEKLGLMAQPPPFIGLGALKASPDGAPRETTATMPISQIEPTVLDRSRQETVKKRILWVVAENWDGAWFSVTKETLMTSSGLGRWVADEATDYGWQMEFPGQAPKELPLSAEHMPPWMEEARQLGASHLIVGTAQRMGHALAVRLDLMEVSSARCVGTVDEQVSGLGQDLVEGLLLLAAVTVSRMEAVFSGGPVAVKPAPIAPAAATADLPLGIWEIAVTGDAAYAAWLAMEKRLSEMSREFAVDSVVLESKGVKARTRHLHPEAAKVLDGIRVGAAMVVRLEGIDPSARMLTFTVEPVAAKPEASPAKELKTP